MTKGPSGHKYYPAFDYLRIVLAIFVVAAPGHAGIISWSNSGNYAVQVFFALSGWLIGGILLNSASSDLPRFYFDRAARIWIPYFAAITLLLVASLIKDGNISRWFAPLFLYDITFVYNFFGHGHLEDFYAMPLKGTGDHFWSICAEEQFYLFAPFFITVLPARFGRSILFWCTISAITLTFAWDYFGAISLGVLASIANARFGGWHTIRSVRTTLIIIALGGGVAIYLNLIAYRIGAPICAIATVLLFAQRGSYSPIGSFVGGISYPLYLNHWIGIFTANTLFGWFGLRDTRICQFGGVLFALAIATALYVVIDRNVRNKRDQYFTVFRGKMVACTGFMLLGSGILYGVAQIGAMATK